MSLVVTTHRGDREPADAEISALARLLLSLPDPPPPKTKPAADGPSATGKCPARSNAKDDSHVT